jgi:hypothetical protein
MATEKTVLRKTAGSATLKEKKMAAFRVGRERYLRLQFGDATGRVILGTRRAPVLAGPRTRRLATREMVHRRRWRNHHRRQKTTVEVAARVRTD